MPEEKKTNVLSNKKAVKSPLITSDLSALYEVLRTSPDSKVKKDTAAHLLRLVEEEKDIDEGVLTELFHEEKDMGVAAAIKRVLNKIQIRKLFMEDPTTKYDRKLSYEEECKILDEIDRLRKLYDKSYEEKGAFSRKYRIVNKIADGGMGIIYKAVRREDNQEVAIKFLLLEELSKRNDRERIIARFKREAGILKKLHHPTIVKVFEYGEADGEYFIVMEYVEGKTLEDIIKEKPLDFKEFKEISLRICDTVEYIHKNGIIHRDIKPANILVQRNRIQKSGFRKDEAQPMKLIDFGLAKDTKDSRLSKVLFQAYSEKYSSPQQMKDSRDVDVRDDIFSIGKTFYEMLTGKTFENNDKYLEISKIYLEIPVDIDIIVKKCIMARREGRFQNLTELKQAIQQIHI